MTKAEQAKMKARERAKRHYEKKKAERENSALENDVEPAEELTSRHLSLVEQSKGEEAQFEAVEQPNSDERAVESPSEPPPIVPTKPSAWRKFGTVARVFIVGALTVLMAILQADFYRQHDVSPTLAWPFAIAVELGFLSLVTLKFRGYFDWVRRLVLLVVFLYFAATLIFQIGYRARENLIRSNSVEVGELKEQLIEAQANLEVAKKGRSWENMRLFGDQVGRLQIQIQETPKAKALGMRQSEVALFEAILLVVMRVLLLAISGLNTVRLREGLGSQNGK